MDITTLEALADAGDRVATRALEDAQMAEVDAMFASDPDGFWQASIDVLLARRAGVPFRFDPEAW